MLIKYLESPKSEKLYEISRQNLLIGKITLEVKKNHQYLQILENDDPFEVAIQFLHKNHISISSNIEKLINLVYDLKLKYKQKLEEKKL